MCIGYVKSNNGYLTKREYEAYVTCAAAIGRLDRKEANDFDNPARAKVIAYLIYSLLSYRLACVVGKAATQWDPGLSLPAVRRRGTRKD